MSIQFKRFEEEKRDELLKVAEMIRKYRELSFKAIRAKTAEMLGVIDNAMEDERAYSDPPARRAMLRELRKAAGVSQRKIGEY